jgi:hypothetical protein
MVLRLLVNSLCKITLCFNDGGGIGGKLDTDNEAYLSLGGVKRDMIFYGFEKLVEGV